MDIIAHAKPVLVDPIVNHVCSLNFNFDFSLKKDVLVLFNDVIHSV